MGVNSCFVHFLVASVLLHVHGAGGQSLNQTCDPADLEALLAFSKGLGTNGAGLVGWGPNDTSSCCSWTGVSCDLGRVVGLDLSNKSLNGGISSLVASLDGLVAINLSRNSLRGQAPVELGRLPGLRVLDLSVNFFSGGFPATEDSFPAIEVVNISFNSFHGPHPAVPAAAKLTVLDISGNTFSGGINSSALCHTPTVVEVLRFSGNGFSGEVPSGLSRCKALVELSLDGNDLAGNLPFDLYALPKLRRLGLQENQLTGSLDNALGNLSQLVQLDLSYNRFTGSIPDVFGGVRRLESINLASNGFDGELPTSLSWCPMLRVIRLRNNSLSGEIAAIDFTLLSRLNTFDIGTNNLSGAIPPGIALCTELRIMNLARNKLVVEIPESFKDFRSLSYLALDGNGFTNLSSALRVMQQLPSLTSLVLTKNFRGETMPVDGIRGFKSVKVFVLANCLLTGIIPPWLQSLENLNLLDISWNKLNGNIPPWLGKLDKLFYIDLSNNSFSGEIPISFTQMRSLISTNDSSEQSPTEDLPLFIKNNSTGTGLQYKHFSRFPPSLILSNNLLHGPILSSFGRLVKLHVLDLSWNNFSGPIPHELSGMSSLEVLNLAHNNLNGSIPSSLTKLSFLSNFDASYNNLSGAIPTGGQFSTFSDEDFAGNSALCSLWNSSCFQALQSEDEHHGMDTSIQITRIMVEAGFASGLLTVWSALYFARPWRTSYFRLIDRLVDTPFIWTVQKVTNFRIKRRNEVHP